MGDHRSRRSPERTPRAALQVPRRLVLSLSFFVVTGLAVSLLVQRPAYAVGGSEGALQVIQGGKPAGFCPLRHTDVKAARLQQQAEGWVHEKIPGLGGRPPIEAVGDPDGKEAVEALLLPWERHDEKDVSPNQIRPDIGAIRRLLNLVPQAS